MALIVTLILHGETDWNVERRFQGQTDVPLSGTGKFQALQLAERFRAEEFRPDVLISSDLGRAVETAEILSPVLGVKPFQFEGWRERNMGVFEGLTREEMQKNMPDAYAAWQADKDGYEVPGGESYLNLRQRVGLELMRLRARFPAGRVVVVTHGGVIYSALSLAADAIHPVDPSVRVRNTSVTRLEARPKQGWDVIQESCASHLGE